MTSLRFQRRSSCPLWQQRGLQVSCYDPAAQVYQMVAQAVEASSKRTELQEAQEDQQHAPLTKVLLQLALTLAVLEVLVELWCGQTVPTAVTVDLKLEEAVPGCMAAWVAMVGLREPGGPAPACLSRPRQSAAVVDYA